MRERLCPLSRCRGGRPRQRLTHKKPLTQYLIVYIIDNSIDVCMRRADDLESFYPVHIFGSCCDGGALRANRRRVDCGECEGSERVGDSERTGGHTEPRDE